MEIVDVDRVDTPLDVARALKLDFAALLDPQLLLESRWDLLALILLIVVRSERLSIDWHFLLHTLSFSNF